MNPFLELQPQPYRLLLLSLQIFLLLSQRQQFPGATVAAWLLCLILDIGFSACVMRAKSLHYQTETRGPRNSRNAFPKMQEVTDEGGKPL